MSDTEVKWYADGADKTDDDGSLFLDITSQKISENQPDPFHQRAIMECLGEQFPKLMAHGFIFDDLITSIYTLT